ncbi:NUDIX hydrolase [Pseudomonas sichuanensis]|uniref:NUDIX hydrolase n=1 Tax=Pseudomonas sichuanensis TaxID=2213015 RepID=UPI0036F13FA2
MTGVINIAAALMLNSEGRALLVRKQGTTAFMQPGGKIEGQEQPREALVRELAEELNIVVELDAPIYLGTYTAAAANEPGWSVKCELFRLETDKTVIPAAEIAEAVWVDASSLIDLDLAPLTRDLVLPLHFNLR